MARLRQIYPLPGFRPSRIAGSVAAIMALCACSAAPVRMECGELKARMNLTDLSEDQRRFASEELAECENRLMAAEKRDSAFVDSAHGRFTPDED